MTDHVRAVMATYERDEPAKGFIGPRTMFKTFDKTIKVDDYVIIPTSTRHEMTVVKIVEVDVEVDYNSTAQVGWIVGKVDRVNYQDVVAQENQAIDAVKKGEKAALRRKLMSELALSRDEIQALPIATIGGDAPTE